MSRWFRHYAGMMADPKFGAIARRSKTSRAEVLFVWGCILESAAESESAAYVWDADLCGELLNCDSERAQLIHDEMERSGLVAGGRVTSWDRRQFVSDNSTERSRKHRATKRNGDATLQGVAASPPKTETETYTVPNGTAEPAASAEPDYRHLVWTETVQTVIRLFGKPEAPARSFVGKCLKEAKDDARLVWAKVRQAEADRVVDPAAWIAAAVRSQPPPQTPANDLTASVLAYAEQAGARH
jgi:hypothetical protein